MITTRNLDKVDRITRALEAIEDRAVAFRCVYDNVVDDDRKLLDRSTAAEFEEILSLATDVRNAALTIR